MKTILSLDPGETTGYVVAAWDGKSRTPKILESGTFTYDETVNYRYLANTVDVIVIEDFILRKNLIGTKIRTIRVIGFFEILFKDKVVFQQPAQKQQFPDARLRKEGYYTKSLHTRDAIRHLLIYCSKQHRQYLRQRKKRKT